MSPTPPRADEALTDAEIDLLRRQLNSGRTMFGDLDVMVLPDVLACLLSTVDVLRDRASAAERDVGFYKILAEERSKNCQAAEAALAQSVARERVATLETALETAQSLLHNLPCAASAFKISEIIRVAMEPKA